MAFGFIISIPVTIAATIYSACLWILWILLRPFAWTFAVIASPFLLVYNLIAALFYLTFDLLRHFGIILTFLGSAAIIGLGGGIVAYALARALFAILRISPSDADFIFPYGSAGPRRSISGYRERRKIEQLQREQEQETESLLASLKVESPRSTGMNIGGWPDSMSESIDHHVLRQTIVEEEEDSDS